MPASGLGPLGLALALRFLLCLLDIGPAAALEAVVTPGHQAIVSRAMPRIISQDAADLSQEDGGTGILAQRAVDGAQVAYEDSAP